MKSSWIWAEDARICLIGWVVFTTTTLILLGALIAIVVTGHKEFDRPLLIGAIGVSATLIASQILLFDYLRSKRYQRQREKTEKEEEQSLSPSSKQ